MSEAGLPVLKSHPEGFQVTEDREHAVSKTFPFRRRKLRQTTGTIHCLDGVPHGLFMTLFELAVECEVGHIH